MGDGMAVLHQLKDEVNKATGKVAFAAVRCVSGGNPFERSLLGDMKKRVYCRMKRHFNAAVDEADEQGLRARYEWLKQLQREIFGQGVPSWLR
jgi:hypothetical protein